MCVRGLRIDRSILNTPRKLSFARVFSVDEGETSGAVRCLQASLVEVHIHPDFEECDIGKYRDVCRKLPLSTKVGYAFSSRTSKGMYN